jgi:isomerase DpgB
MSVNIGNPGLVEARLDLSASLSKELIGEITEICLRAEDAAGEQVLVLRLTGGAGSGWLGRTGVHLVGKWENALRRLERLARFKIGVCDGPISQAVLEVLLVTDYRIAGNATVLHLGGVATGSWPGLSLHRLVQQIGVAHARRLTLLPGEFTGRQLLDAGVVDDLVVDVDAGIAAVADRSAGATGSEVAVWRQLMLDAVTIEQDAALGMHLAACDRTLRRAVHDVGAD